jgi:2-iminobutanoate/2-iminopropanoate deaminase
MNRRLAHLAALALLLPLGGAMAQNRVVATPNAPEAIGPDSQAIRLGNTLCLAGQVALDPRTKQMIADRSIEAETREVRDNLKAVVEAAGFRLSDIVSTTVFMADLNEFARIPVSATCFPSNRRRARRCRRRGRRAT